jgi:hypothetical protein
MADIVVSPDILKDLKTVAEAAALPVGAPQFFVPPGAICYH